MFYVSTQLCLLNLFDDIIPHQMHFYKLRIGATKRVIFFLCPSSLYCIFITWDGMEDLFDFSQCQVLLKIVHKNIIGRSNAKQDQRNLWSLAQFKDHTFSKNPNLRSHILDLESGISAHRTRIAEIRSHITDQKS